MLSLGFALLATNSLSHAARLPVQITAGAGALEIVGKLTGDDVAVMGAVSIDVVNGRSTATLASGSEVTVRSGQAKLDLVDGGDIAICGPARFSVLKAGGSITLALDYGRVHPQLDSPVSIAIYTPLIVATPVAIGQGARDITVGLDSAGQMCALTASGAVRVEQQLTGQSLIVPQGGEVHMAGGELSTLRPTNENCGCDLMATKGSSVKEVELSVPIHPPVEPAPQPAQPSTPPPAETVYRVDMPPLTFDAKSPEPPPDPDPSTMLLIRETRVAPEVVFRGRVEEAAPVESSPEKSEATKPADVSPKRPFVIVRFFRWLRGRSSPRCAGSGCGSSNN
jgi:hypothetical protein